MKRHSNQQQEIKICPICTVSFVDDKMSGRPATYCSNKCAQRAWYERKKELALADFIRRIG